MHAIVQDTYGSVEVLALAGHRQAPDRRRRGAGSRPRGLHPRRRLDPDDGLAVRHALRHRPAKAEEPRSRNRCRGHRRGGRARTSRDLRPGDEVFGWGAGAFAEYARASEDQLLAEAGRSHLRAGGSHRRVRLDRPPAPARRRRGPARPEGPDQRGVRRRRHVRRPDRQGARCRGHGRDQHQERRDGPLDRRRPRHRLHAGRLHHGRRALRPHPRQRRQPLDGPDPARADPGRDAHLQRRRARRRQARPHRPGDARVDGRAPAGEPDGQDAEPRRPGRPQGPGRSREGDARHRPDLPAERDRPGDRPRRGGARPRDGRASTI